MNEMTRTKSSFKNMLASLIGNIMAIIIGLISQAFFLKILNTEYLGLTSLFTNIISLLSVVELGIGSSLIYKLYEPIAMGDKESIKSLMRFYKKSYVIIGFIVLILGLLLLPILKTIIGNIALNINIYIVYLLFLLDAVISYFLAYKRSMFYASQKNYVIKYLHIGYAVILNVVEIIVLYSMHNYYFYLLSRILFRMLENINISLLADKHYPYLKEKSKPLDATLKKDIKITLKALCYHRIGTFMINSTDNIIISYYLGLNEVGLYANYYLIISTIESIVGQIIDAITPSIGNLLVENNVNKEYYIFKKIRFLNFWLSSLTAICLYVLLEPFITLWLGSEYILDHNVLLILILNYFQKSSRNVYLAFRSAKGTFNDDKYVPIIESILNIFFSVILVKKLGLMGVFIGTIISSVPLWFYSHPKYVYKKMLNGKIINYFKETISYFILFIFLLFMINFTVNMINFNNVQFCFILRLFWSLLFVNISLIIIFYKNENYNYYIIILKKLLKKK